MLLSCFIAIVIITLTSYIRQVWVTIGYHVDQTVWARIQVSIWVAISGMLHDKCKFLVGRLKRDVHVLQV